LLILSFNKIETSIVLGFVKRAVVNHQDFIMIIYGNHEQASWTDRRTK